MAQRTLSDDDQGKRVVNANGDRIGMISDVRGGTGYVDPDPGMAERIMSKLGWSDRDDDDYPLDESKIDAITGDEVRLKRDL
ncbi:PRC-barrel domain containing protein [Halorarum halobium]|uniref:PRC-barrel domain containing protein n=1 Tax=Halorarum halobium TaxID=3075121 RepID=UPI0028B1E46D|nr:PRC-barrel domain containing protein [Halobaculum sp. XH14]